MITSDPVRTAFDTIGAGRYSDTHTVMLYATCGIIAVVNPGCLATVE